MAFLLRMGQRPHIGEAAGQAIGGGLNMLIQQYRNEKAGEALGLPKGFTENFSNVEDAVNAYSKVQSAQMYKRIADRQTNDGQQEFHGQKDVKKATEGLPAIGELFPEYPKEFDPSGQDEGIPKESLEAFNLPQRSQLPVYDSEIAQLALMGSPGAAPLAQMKQVESAERDRAIASTKDFRKEISANRSNAQQLIGDIETIRSAQRSGKIGPGIKNFTIEALSDAEGWKGALAKGLQSSEVAQFQQAAQRLAQNATRELTSRPSQMEVQWNRMVKPSILKSPASNEASLAQLEKGAQIKLLESQVYDSLVKANGGVPPFDIEQRVHQYSKPYWEKAIKSAKETTGESGKESVYYQVDGKWKRFDIPIEQIKGAKAAGGKSLKELEEMRKAGRGG